MSDADNPETDRRTVLAEERTKLAIKRSTIAAERTLMAWIRTAISMIGFGFTIYKFFQYLPLELATGRLLHPHAPRNLGLSLIALGTVSLAAATLQYRNFLKDIGVSHSHQLWSISFIVAIAVVFMGILAFYGILLRHVPF